MGKLTREALQSLRKEASKAIDARENSKVEAGKVADKCYILVCAGTGCVSNKSDLLCAELEKEAKAQGVGDQVQVIKTGCFGFCEKGTIVKILPYESFYVEVKIEDAKEIIAAQIKQGHVVSRLLYHEAGSKEDKKFNEIGFYSKQTRVVLRNCGIIDPEKIDDYIGRDGYAALEKVLFEQGPEQTLEVLKTSGLRGRGGAGFPTWMKWDFTRKATGDVKYIICNADEGDPGAYMNRSTIEGDPHAVIEGMIIGAKTIGANAGYVYIRAEYPLAVDRLQLALDQARAYGLLGDNILGSGFNFDLEIRLGAGAFVCGEETALLQSLEGKRGMPLPKPPFPATSGLWQKPTVINNVETFANVPIILINGGEWFSKLGKPGSEKSTGTKTFALTGKIKNSGLIEVPMGTTLREIVYDIGGGTRSGKPLKGVQTGGPSGGIITGAGLDKPITYEGLMEMGSMMGSGGMIIMDEDDCVVDIAKFYMDFCHDESCGKCAPCRIGTQQMLAILERISNGSGKEEDLDKLERIGKAMQKASLCMLGGSAPNPTLSTIKHFREEYLAHIRDHKCPAGKCKDLVVYEVIPEKCIGCTACARKCPVSCIAGEKKQVHFIDQSKCIKCGECYKACKFDAIKK